MAEWDNPWSVAWDLLGSALFVWAFVRIVRTPTEHFEHGNRSRVLRIVAAFGVWFSIAGFAIPVGAIWLLNNPPLPRPQMAQ